MVLKDRRVSEVFCSCDGSGVKAVLLFVADVMGFVQLLDGWQSSYTHRRGFMTEPLDDSMDT